MIMMGVRMGECFFWYQLTRVVSDKGPLNGCVCVCEVLQNEHAYSPVNWQKKRINQTQSQKQELSLQ